MAGCTALASFLRESAGDEFTGLKAQLTASLEQDAARLITLYQQAIPLIEKQLWSSIPDDAALANYQTVFRELENHITLTGEDDRHHMILFIPVADRPRHLSACLNSLLQLCQRYGYGGYADNRYRKISLLIGDDSRDEASIRQHQEIVKAFNEQGLHTIYFGQTEQLQQLAKLSEAQQQALLGVLGEANPSAFYHKGSPRMRNIAHLKLHELAQAQDKVLFYSLDSDQEFQVKVSTPDGDRDCYGINFFYHLDNIFTKTDSCILTGKVVGDPPVSPAVMAGNFLEDVTHFMEQMAGLEHGQACQFHDHPQQKSDDAAYHDMAEMFGFKRAADSYHYPCPIHGEHDNDRCFSHFANQVNAFFYGEHPTRKTFYEFNRRSDALSPARTVYPGNYVFNKEGLNYFIPFAPHKLRMNGPVMGRVVKALLKERFVSANLPMLHKRTVDDTGQSEFRPDIHQQAASIDLSGEFERQYFGDVMLFSMEKLTAMGYPTKELKRETISTTVNETEQNLQQHYQAKHEEIMRKLHYFRSLLEDENNWWHHTQAYAPAIAALRAFADNIEHNYGEDAFCYGLINSDTEKRTRLTQIINAIQHYPQEQQAWETLMQQDVVMGDSDA